MVKKIIFSVIFCIVLLSAYVVSVINEDRNIIRFAASYVFFNRSDFVTSDKLNSCSFSKMKLKNNVELKCESLKEFCDSKIPARNNEINKDTACAVVTFEIPSKSKTNNKFHVLSYTDGITTIPNSVEHEFLFSKDKSLRGKIREALSFYEIIDLMKNSK